MPRVFKIIVERHADGYVAYPVGLKGVVVAQGDTYDEALEDARSAVAFHIESFGVEVFDDEESPVLEVFVAEASVGA
jgi:predicted RNase H-like HicB family nuclease